MKEGVSLPGAPGGAEKQDTPGTRVKSSPLRPSRRTVPLGGLV